MEYLELNILCLHLQIEHVINRLHQFLEIDLLLYLLELAIFEHVHIQHVIHEIQEQLGRVFDYVRHPNGLTLAFQKNLQRLYLRRDCIDWRSHLVTYCGGDHFLQITLVFLELELKIIGHISEDYHRARYIIILYIDNMQANGFAIAKSVIITVLRIIIEMIHNLVKAVRMTKNEGIFN